MNCRLNVLFLLPLACVAHAADRSQVYRLAQERDPVYGAARTTLEVSQEKEHQARAGLLSNVGAVGELAEPDVAAVNALLDPANLH